MPCLCVYLCLWKFFLLLKWPIFISIALKFTRVYENFMFSFFFWKKWFMVASSVANIQLKTNYFICCGMQFLQSKMDSILYFFLHRIICFCFHCFRVFQCLLRDEVSIVQTCMEIYMCVILNYYGKVGRKIYLLKMLMLFVMFGLYAKRLKSTISYCIS